MKFSVSSSFLLAQLQNLNKVVPSKSSIAILEEILFDLNGNELTLTASDGETTIRTTIEVEGEGNGKITLNAKRLLETLNALAEQKLVFDINDQNFALTLRSSNGEYKVIGHNGLEYPEMVQSQENLRTFTMASEALVSILNRTTFCTGDDELRPVMNGVLFDLGVEYITCVATDAHRLVRITNKTVQVPEPVNFILPKKPANLLRSIMAKDQSEVTIAFDNKNIRFSFGSTVILCRQIEGRYPNYNAVIPNNNPFEVVIDRQTLLSAAKRVAIYATASTSLIKLEIRPNKIHISAQDIDLSTSAEEEIECAYTGDDINIGFKAQFLIEILTAIVADNIIIRLKDSSRAGIIMPHENAENEEVTMLLMPMLLND